MADRRFRDLVRLNEAQRESLLARMNEAALNESRALCAVRDDGRTDTRYAYSRPTLPIAVEHPGGGFATLMVCARNISSGGIAFIHGGFLHPSTICKIILEKLDGERIAVDGVVVNSRHLRGSLHEINVRFERRIELATFLSGEERKRSMIRVDQCRPEFGGRVLGLQTRASDARILESAIEGTGIDITLVNRPGDAIDAVKLRTYDIAFLDLDLGDDDPLDVIADIRAAGHEGRLIAIGAADRRSDLEAARKAGATDTLSKPFSQKAIGALLKDLGKGAPQDQPNPEAERFARRAAEIARSLNAAVERESLAEVASLCDEIAAAAPSPAFRSIVDAASKLRAELDDLERIADMASEIRRLAEMCAGAAA